MSADVVTSACLPAPTTNPQAPNKNSNQRSSPPSLLEAARLLPTPTAADHKRPRLQTDARDRPNGLTLTAAIAAGELLNTPRSSGASLAGGSHSASAARARGTHVSGYLNPSFVEWMMGLPPGWTASSSSGTASCPRPPPERGASYGGD